MATTDQLRNDISALVRLAERDLDVLFAEAADGRSQVLRAALMDVLPVLVATYGAAAASVAADWYDELRAEAGVTGRFTAIPAELRDAGASGLVGYAMGTATDEKAFRSLISGGLQLRVANASRQTVMGSAIADPRATGWQRVGSGSSCPFCSMLIGRGAVYTEAGVDFGAHDHDDCQAAPAFVGQPRPVKPFTPSSRNITDADRERARAWIASH